MRTTTRVALAIVLVLGLMTVACAEERNVAPLIRQITSEVNRPVNFYEGEVKDELITLAEQFFEQAYKGNDPAIYVKEVYDPVWFNAAPEVVVGAIRKREPVMIPLHIEENGFVVAAPENDFVAQGIIVYAEDGKVSIIVVELRAEAGNHDRT